MRSLRRPRVAVPTLSEGGVGARERQRVATLAAAPTQFAPHWRRPDVRGALRAMQGWVCAYCQRALTDGDEVEHFRPKALYWWLAYDLSNYFLACHRCNRADVKGARFPLAPESPRATVSTPEVLQQERPMIADPARDPVDDWFEVDVADGTFPVVVREGVGAREAEVARETIAFFQYNTDATLVRERARAYVEAVARHDRGDHDTLRANATCVSPQSATWRAFLRQAALAELNEDPDAHREVLWGELLERLRTHVRVREAHGESDGAARSREEMLWALAAIVTDADATTREALLQRLREESLDGDVSTRAEALAPLRGTTS